MEHIDSLTMHWRVVKMSNGGNVVKRNYGIDLLRIVSMFMVVVLHTLGQGGILGYTVWRSTNYNISWFLEIACFCAVNCYALISGYVSVNTKFSYKRLFPIWLTVVFYTSIITLYYSITIYDLVGKQLWLNAFCPITTNQYWYFTDYFCLFMAIPILNLIVNKLDKSSFQKLIITIVVLFSIIPTFARIDLFNTSGGYSAIWLMALYLIGAYIKKYSFGVNLNGRWYLLIYLSCITLTWGSNILINYYYFTIPKFNSYDFTLINYTSPTILVAGISLLLFFRKLRIRNILNRGLIKTFAPLSFSVYIIHTNPLIWTRFLYIKFIEYAQYSPIKLISYVLITTFIIYLICSLIDFVRLQIFKLLKVNNWCNYAISITNKIKNRENQNERQKTTQNII